MAEVLLVLALLACTPEGTVRGPGAHEPHDSGQAASEWSLEPTRLVLQPGHTAQLHLHGATWDEVGLVSSDPDLVGVEPGGIARAAGWGEATLTATAGTRTADVEVVVAHEEVRGLWVTRWTYKSAADLDAILDDCVQMGGNTVYLQVRGRFDAFYASDLEPWASELGALGRDPGWDPLEHAVTAAHARGLELHAYLNTYPMWSGSSAPDSEGVPHPREQNAAWVVHDDAGSPMPLNASYVFASPGNPAVRAHVIAVAADVADRYDVDGIHLDYVRYPGPEYSHDPASLAAWGGEGDYGDWQRAAIVDTLLELRQRIDVPLTGAVWGITTNEFGWGGVSEGNEDYYQDARAFLAQGALDATLPMIYWPATEPPGGRLDFRTLAASHVDHASGRHVYAGVSTASLSWDEVDGCIRAAREVGAHGAVLFDYAAVRDKGWVDDLAEGPWGDPAVLPPLPWRE